MLKNNNLKMYLFSFLVIEIKKTMFFYYLFGIISFNKKRKFIDINNWINQIIL